MAEAPTVRHGRPAVTRPERQATRRAALMERNGGASGGVRVGEHGAPATGRGQEAGLTVNMIIVTDTTDGVVAAPLRFA